MSGDASIPSSTSSLESTITPTDSHDNDNDNDSTPSLSVNPEPNTNHTTAREHQEEQRESTPPRTSQTSSSSSPTQQQQQAETNSSSPSSSSSSSSGPPSRRVKVYKLKDDAWVDLGTGTCQGVLIQQNSPPGDMEVDLEDKSRREKVDPADEGAWIVVKREKGKKSSEGGGGGSSDDEAEEQQAGGDTNQDDDDDDDEKDVILKTRVQPYPPGYSEDFDEEELLEGEDGQTLDVGGYQRQQDTLIVWTERGDGDEELEMALSFATSTGCAEMWEFIKAARRFTAEQALLSPSPSPSPSSPRTFPMHANFTPTSNQLPTPSLGTIPQLEATIRQLSRTTISRERTALQIVKSQFVEKLIQVHQEAEDLESLDDLHALCRVMQTILLLNDNSIFELVLKDELILGVAGILEYDPDFPTMKASYRSHLSSPTSFISLVPIRSPALLSKIHQTHRLHYLKDVILARILEDSTFSMLNSAIYFNEVEIVNEVVGERELIREVFKILDDGVVVGSVAKGNGNGKGKGKGKERELGPQRTIGPELPQDLEEQKLTKKPKETSTSQLQEEGMQVDPSSSSSTTTAAIASTSSARDATIQSSTELEPSQLLLQQRKQHAIQFLAQLTQMAKNLQLPLRTSLYRTLVERGLLPALEKALYFANELKDVGLRASVIGIWMSVVDLDAKDVRAYCLRQGKEKEKSNEEEEESSEKKDGKKEEKEEEEENKLESTMLGGLIDTFKVEEDLGIKTQLAEALRVLVDAAGDGGPLEAPPRLRAPEDPEAEKFLQYFYDHCILTLLQPLIDLPERQASDPPLELSPARTALLSHLCDLLCFFIAHHTFRSKYLILSSPQLAKSVSFILRPRPRLTRHTHLRLAALRFFRACVARNDDFYNRFLIKHDLVRCVIETAEDEKDKDNLLGSACLEFFEYIRGTNAKALINHVMDRSGDQVRKLAPTFKTFEGFVARWEINNEPPPPSSTTLKQSSSTSPGEAGSNGSVGAMSEAMQRQTSKPGWPAAGRMDVEEESYFNADDDDDDESKENPSTATTATVETLTPATPTTSFHFASSRRKREPTSNPALSSSLNESKRVKLDDEVDDEEEEQKKLGNLPRSQTWPQGAGGKSGVGLVDYMDEDEEESTTTTDKSKGEDKESKVEGGFIREDESTLTRTTTSTSESTPPSSKQDSDLSPAPFVPLPLPGSLKRKQEEEEEEEGLGGLLRSKSIKKETSSPPKSKAKSPIPTSSSAPSLASAKPGGFKISFGSSVSKPAPAKTAMGEDGKPVSGFGKFGGGTGNGTTSSSSATTKRSSPEADKG